MCQQENRQERVGQCMMVQAESTETFLWGRGPGDASVVTKKIHHSLFLLFWRIRADNGSYFDASLDQEFASYLLFLQGVTDFKAVKGSSTSEEGKEGLQPSLLLVLAVFGAAICVTVMTLCVFITFRRQVSSLWSDFYSSFLSYINFLGAIIQICSVLIIVSSHRYSTTQCKMNLTCQSQIPPNFDFDYFIISLRS